jgi:hypothetical protein
VAPGEGVDGGEAEWWLYRCACLSGEVVLTQGSDELVDLAERLAGDFLDRLERGPRAFRVLLREQPRRAGLDEDHVDRVPRRVMEVACDAGALLSGGQAALALGFPLGPEGSLLELGNPRAPLADAVADHPRPTPDEGSVEERDGGELVLGDTDRTGMDHVKAGHDESCQPPRCARPLGAQGEEVEGDGRAERGAGRIAEAVQHRACCGGQREHRQRCTTPGDEGQSGECDKQRAEQVEVARARSGVATGGEQREGGSEHGNGGCRVQHELPTP